MPDPILHNGETARAFDLSQPGYRRVWDVSTLDRGVLRFDMVAGSIGSAAVTVEQSRDGRAWEGLASAVVVNASAIASGAEGMTTREISFTTIRQIAAVVTTPKAGAVAAITLYGKNAQTIAD